MQNGKKARFRDMDFKRWTSWSSWFFRMHHAQDVANGARCDHNNQTWLSSVCLCYTIQLKNTETLQFEYFSQILIMFMEIVDTLSLVVDMGMFMRQQCI